MSQQSVENFLGRLLTDDDFRQDVQESFARSCALGGYSFSAEEEAILCDLSLDAFRVLSGKLDRRIKRAAGLKGPREKRSKGGGEDA